MIFYLVPAAQGRPAMLQPTQADANREAKDRGLKVRAPDMEHNVPTSKAELMGYVNCLLANRVTASASTVLNEADETVGTVTGDPHSEDEAGPDNTSLRAAAMASDGHPEARAAFTVTQVAAATLPKSPVVQDVCHAVSKMTPADLGFVALEVIARGARLGGLA